MVRLAMAAVSPEVGAVDLSRLTARLQHILLKPDAETDRRLLRSPAERTKVGANIEYASTLLLRLEQDAIIVKSHRQKQKLQAELVQKRDIIERMRERLQELDELYAGIVDDSSEEDLLGDDTPSDDDELPAPAPQVPERPESEVPREAEALAPPVPREPEETAPDVFPSALRSRHATSSAHDRAFASGANVPSVATEHVLENNKEEQDTLTESLLSMAEALKDSSRAFAQSLESEKDVLNQASRGLDKNRTDMDSAQRRMNILRSMTEGRGWWGRMMLYAWIAALMLIAIFIVGFLPKLRF